MKNKNVKKEIVNTSQNKLRNSSKSPLYKTSTNFTNNNFSPKKTHQTTEDTIEIKIPTPYPKSQYMLMTDPSLINSPYTAILNEKYPQRKYLRHNLTSWLRCNKNKNRDISVKIMNPELKYKHDTLNLKKLTYNEEVNEFEINKLEDALDVIRKLKLKVLEYEETNNNNIEASFKIIDELKAENEFFKKKLLDNYEILDKYEERYGDLAIIGEYTYSTIQKFEKKFASIKVFSLLKQNLKRIKTFREKFTNFKKNKEFVLKIKAFLSLQKNVMIENYSHKLEIKRCYQLYKNAFNSLKSLIFLSRLTKKFYQIQKTIRLIFYFKTLRVNIGNKKVFSIYNKKSSSFHFRKKIKIVFDVLKYNVYFNREKGITKKKERKESINLNEKAISYLNFLKDINSLELDPEIKEKKFKALRIFKNLYDNHIEKKQYFFINRKKILLFYIRLWKTLSSGYYNVASLSKKIKIYYYTLFIENCKENKRQILNKIRLRSLFTKFKQTYYKFFFKKINKKLTIVKNTHTLRKYIDLRSKAMIINTLKKRAEANVYSKFKRMSKIIKAQSFFETIKKRVLNSKNKFIIHERIKRLREQLYVTNMISSFKNKYIYLIRKRILSKKRKIICSNRIVHINLLKYFSYLRIKTFRKNLRRYKENINKISYDMKMMIDEKNEKIREIENENTELSIRLKSALETLKQDKIENEEQRKTILALENKIKENTAKFNELWNQNVKDIKNLEETLKNNEKILNNAIHREEQMQNKYCTDINNAINLNKQLNTIINKKNLQINDLKTKISNQEKSSTLDKKKLISENADLYNTFAQIYSKKNNQIKQINYEKDKILNEAKNMIDDLEEQKIKNEFKASLLEDEHKVMFNQYIEAIKKTSKN